MIIALSIFFLFDASDFFFAHTFTTFFCVQVVTSNEIYSDETHKILQKPRVIVSHKIFLALFSFVL